MVAYQQGELDAFEELFQQEPEGFIPQWIPDVREVLMTWETGQQGDNTG